MGWRPRMLVKKGDGQGIARLGPAPPQGLEKKPLVHSQTSLGAGVPSGGGIQWGPPPAQATGRGLTFEAEPQC